MEASADGWDVVLRGGRVIDPGSGHDGSVDIGITDGRIAAIEPDISADIAHQVIDVAGKIVTTGMKTRMLMSTSTAASG